MGIGTAPLPDGRFGVDGPETGVVAAERLVVLGIRHAMAARRQRFGT